MCVRVCDILYNIRWENESLIRSNWEQIDLYFNIIFSSLQFNFPKIQHTHTRITCILTNISYYCLLYLCSHFIFSYARRIEKESCIFDSNCCLEFAYVLLWNVFVFLRNFIFVQYKPEFCYENTHSKSGYVLLDGPTHFCSTKRWPYTPILCIIACNK